MARFHTIRWCRESLSAEAYSCCRSFADCVVGLCPTNKGKVKVKRVACDADIGSVFRRIRRVDM